MDEEGKESGRAEAAPGRFRTGWFRKFPAGIPEKKILRQFGYGRVKRILERISHGTTL